MLWPLLFVLIFVVFAWKDMYGQADGFLDRCAATFFFGIFASIVFFFGIGFASVIGLAVPKHWTGPETTGLVSLRGSDGLSGQFYLGTGSIDTTQHYFFYEAVGLGYRPRKIEIEGNVTVFEDEERKVGELKTYTYQFVNPNLLLVGLDYPTKKYEFFIPRGSIKRDFMLQ